MRSARLAEWILSLVTPPDRAASTVGDLLEESRRAIWFWFAVLRTACSHVWRDLSASPRQMVCLAFWGLLQTLVTAGAYVVFPLVIILRVIDFAEPPRGLYSAATVLTWTVVPIVVGWKLARRSRCRELAAIFAMTCFSGALSLLRLYLSALQVRRIGRPWPGGEHAVSSLLITTLFMAAGAILFAAAPIGAPRMLRGSIAEWILSLVIPPDRAASTAGDLLEEATSRGALWF